MPQDPELASLMQAVAEKALQLLNNYKNPSNQFSTYIEKYIEFFTNFQGLINVLVKNPEALWQMQLAYWTDMLKLTETQMAHWLQGEALPIDDKRFGGKEWVDNPFFNLLTQHYLLASRHIQQMLEHLEYEDRQTSRRIQFFTKQYLDALSPANFLNTNPELIAETIQSRGKNLLRGLQNLLDDINHTEPDASHMITMTDLDAFSLGGNLATTKGRVIFQNDIMELIQYQPSTETVHTIPLLIIPPWINKYYILDLSPHNSLIAYLVSQGISVFVISWVNPDASLRDKGLYDYLNEGPLTAIQIIKEQLGVKKINTLGFCIGGTLQACGLAYCKAKKDQSIQSATFLASLIDFSDPGDIAVFIDEMQVTRIEEQMNRRGFLDGDFMASTFNSLRANDLIWSFFIKNYLEGKNPIPFDVLYWNSDATNLPRRIHSQYLRWMYLHNDLVKPNKIYLNDVPLDISQIDVPSFFVSTIKDHIAPWKTTYQGFQLIKGKKQFLLAGSGHIVGIVNPPTSQKYEYYINRNTQISAEAWLEKAKTHPGSWWPYWASWLKKQSGKLVGAPSLDSLPFQSIRDAPGHYVLSKVRPR